MIQGKEHGFRARTPVGLWLVCHSGSVLIRGRSLRCRMQGFLGHALEINVLGREGALTGPGEGGTACDAVSVEGQRALWGVLRTQWPFRVVLK